METKTISVRVNADAAQIYESAPAEEKRKLDALLSSRLREVTGRRKHKKSLKEVMNEISRKAQKRGLTPEKLDEILNEG
jgi:molybdenum cofactor biosynthesis enzyme MoaA